MYNQNKIMRRLLGRTTDSSSDSTLGVTSSHTPQSYRPNASQNAVYPTGAPIACMDRSNDGQFAVLGGSHILKTVQFDGLNIREGVDVRAAITAQGLGKSNASSSTSDQFSVKDVKWATTQGGDATIFTACANGRIFNYNVSRLGSRMPGGTGLELIQMKEDSRQIEKLAINPHRNTWLLSASQDGILRLFDIREPVTNRNGQITFRPRQGFKCHTDGLLDAKWSPRDGMVFACSMGSGTILKWDVRKPAQPTLRINAHESSRGASSISWHPDGEHLISAGLDCKCYVWDMSKDADRKQKPKWTISTPAPVAAVTWRPGVWSATAQGRRAAQVAVSYDDGGTTNRYGIRSVHIWDLARPTLPYKEIDTFDSSPNALLWHDQDLLWTAGSDGLFTQCDVAFAPKVIDRQPLSSLDFSPRGDVIMLLEERTYPQRPQPTTVASELLPTSPYSSSPAGQMLSISRSDSEDDVVGSFLGPRKRAGRKRRPNARSNQNLSTTPPSSHAGEEPVLSLEQAISTTGTFKTQQVMAIGHVPAASKVNVYQYLSVQYLETLETELPYGKEAKPMNERVVGIMEHYAKAAENVSQFRLAQTWRILAYAMNLLLTRRSQYHLEMRTSRHRMLKSPDLMGRSNSKSNLLSLELSSKCKVGDQETQRRPSSIASGESRQAYSRSLLAEEFDSESNLPTPLARPVKDSIHEQHQHALGKELTPVQEIGSFALPPALHPDRPKLRERLDSAPLSIISQDSQISSMDGYDFYDLSAVETLPFAIEVPKKKEPLSLDYVGPATPNSKNLAMARHDSDESFAQMFSVSDGTHTISDGSHRTPDPSSSYTSQRQILRRNGAPVGSNGNSDEEFGSRIRGKQIQESPERARHPMYRLSKREDTSSMEDIFMISQTTADTGDSEHSQDNSQENSQLRSQLNSPNPVDYSAPRLQVTRAVSPRKTSNERLAMAHPEEQTSPTIIETDFMPWPEDPPYPYPLASEMSSKAIPPPLKPYSLLSRAFAFETQRSALNASAMILLLKPLVPDDVIDPHQAAAVLRQHHNRLMSQKLFIEAALLRNVCVRDWPDGIEIWGDNYHSVYAAAQENRRVNVGFKCPQCKRPREVDRSRPDGVWKCERCRFVMAPCAICGHRDATPALLPPIPVADGIDIAASSQEEPVLSTWWYCPGCSHGGHATCLQGWHAPIASSRSNGGSSSGGSPAVVDGLYPETYSDGCCPLDGCGHACLPGKWRDETSTARTEELGRAVREQTRGSISTMKSGSNIDGLASSAPSVISGVRSDALEVPQSRAVEGVREALAIAGISGGSGPVTEERKGRAGGILSVLSSSPKGLSLAAEGGKPEKHERERRKSVKFAGATEERR